MLSLLDDGDAFVKHVVFSDEVSAKVNRHSCRIWGSENPHEVMEHERDTPKLNVWCALTSDSVTGPFFFEKATVTGASHLNMLRNYAITRISQWYFFQQDGAPPHYANTVKAFLNQQFPGKCIELAQPGGPTARVFVLPFLPEDGRRSSFRNVVILLKYRRWTKSKNHFYRL
jgi:hypothetical protein